jgi:hypothetical protein
MQEQEEQPTNQVDFHAGVSQEPAKEEPIILKCDDDFIALAEQDSEGNYAGIFYFHRNQIVCATYSAVQDHMLVTVNAYTTKVGKVYEPLLNKQGMQTKAFAQGIASKTESLSFPFHNRQSIVLLHNFFTGDDATPENFIGFKLYDEMMVKIKDAQERKRVEEEQLKQKEEEKVLLNEMDAENRYRMSINMEPFTLEQFKVHKYGENGKERKSEGGSLADTPGRELEAATDNPLRSYKGGAGEVGVEALEEDDEDEDEDEG